MFDNNGLSPYFGVLKERSQQHVLRASDISCAHACCTCVISLFATTAPEDEAANWGTIHCSKTSRSHNDICL
jgi:hypothetical protein